MSRRHCCCGTPDPDALAVICPQAQGVTGYEFNNSFPRFLKTALAAQVEPFEAGKDLRLPAWSPCAALSGFDRGRRDERNSGWYVWTDGPNMKFQVDWDINLPWFVDNPIFSEFFTKYPVKMTKISLKGPQDFDQEYLNFLVNGNPFPGFNMSHLAEDSNPNSPDYARSFPSSIRVHLGENRNIMTEPFTGGPASSLGYLFPSKGTVEMDPTAITYDFSPSRPTSPDQTIDLIMPRPVVCSSVMVEVLDTHAGFGNHWRSGFDEIKFYGEPQTGYESDLRISQTFAFV